MALPLFISLALIRIAFYLLRRVFARHGPLGNALKTFEKVFALLVWLGVALYITGLWPDVLYFLENTKIPIGKHDPSLADQRELLDSVSAAAALALVNERLHAQLRARLDEGHRLTGIGRAKLGP